MSAEEVRPRKIEGKMKRLGKTSNIVEEICEYSNICNSLHVVMRGTKRKKTRAGRWIMSHEDEVIKKLQEQISSGTFCISGYREMQVTDGPKVRTVQSVSLIERIGCNAIMAVVEDKIFKRYIRTTAASIKRRGMHDLLTIYAGTWRNTQKKCSMPTSLTSRSSMKVLIKIS